MSPRLALLSLVFLAACDDEHWFAYDATEVAVDGPSLVTVGVVTSPEAFPEHLYDAAVRGTFEGPGRLRLAATDPHEPYRIDDRSVNVLDAWDDCDRVDVCEALVTFEVVCPGGCSGTFSVDAFLSTWGPFPSPDAGGVLDLTILDVEPVRTSAPDRPDLGDGVEQPSDA